jgi:hypothetical protein
MRGGGDLQGRRFTVAIRRVLQEYWRNTANVATEFLFSTLRNA